MKCKYCGAEIELHYGESYNANLLNRRECFKCNHFVSTLEYNPERTLIVDGEMYTVRKEDAPSPHGFCGAVFYWEFLNSPVLYKSSNVWHRGLIPDALRPLMPDNACWVSPSEEDFALDKFAILG